MWFARLAGGLVGGRLFWLMTLNNFFVIQKNINQKTEKVNDRQPGHYRSDEKPSRMKEDLSCFNNFLSMFQRTTFGIRRREACIIFDRNDM